MAYFIIQQRRFFSSYDISEEEKEKLDKFLEILEESGVGKIIEKEVERDYSKGGREGVNPYRLYATIAYAFSQHSGSLRKIEESIKYDLRYIYLMEERQASYVTISKFLNNVVVKHHREMYSCIIKTLLKKHEINTDDVFLDGTKLEANANKYKFVWKPIYYHKRLNESIRNMILKYYELPPSKVCFTSKEVAVYLNELEGKIEKSGIEICRGKGHRQIPLVKDFNIISTLLLKTLEYEEKEEICGVNRNSYFKTDRDATAMCLKTDYYSGLGSKMHAAYSLQILVSKGFILEYYVSQERTDVNTLIPSLELFYQDYSFYPKRLCADSGYGSYTNYEYLEKKGIGNYVKFAMWQKMMEGSYIPLYSFDDEMVFKCVNGKIGKPVSISRHPKEKGALFYLIEGCKKCPIKTYCMKTVKDKTRNERIFEASYQAFKYKKTAMENLLSPKGIEMRVNRSSQVEGTFGIIKQNMEYDRIRRRGLEKVTTEISLVCLGLVIRKLFTLIEGKAKIDYWCAPEDLLPQVPKPYSLQKLVKIAAKGKNEMLRYSYSKKAAKNF